MAEVGSRNINQSSVKCGVGQGSSARAVSTAGSRFISDGSGGVKVTNHGRVGVKEHQSGQCKVWGGSRFVSQGSVNSGVHQSGQWWSQWTSVKTGRVMVK